MRQIFRQRGFTLIELMIAISITAVLGTLGIAGFTEFNKTQSLQSSTNDVVTMLTLARSRAQSQVKLGSSCRASFTLEGYSVDISVSERSYTLNSRCSGIPSVLEKKTLPQEISFVPGISNRVSFFFPVLAGGVQVEGVRVGEVNTWGETAIARLGRPYKIIKVDSLGGISVR